LKAWPVSLTLVVAPFLFGALGVAINPKNKETKETVEASAALAVQQKGVGTSITAPAQESPVRTVAASITPTPSPVEQPTATPPQWRLLPQWRRQSLQLLLRPLQRRLRLRSWGRYAESTRMCLGLTLKRTLPK
jgi:hypothetical protein